MARAKVFRQTAPPAPPKAEEEPKPRKRKDSK